MPKYKVDLERVDTTYVSVEVEAETPEDAATLALEKADEEADEEGDITLGHWEPTEIKELESA